MASKLLRISKNLPTISQRLRSSHSADYQAALGNSSQTVVSVTNNNVKVASQSVDSDTTTVGIFFDAGSRYEDAGNNGAGNLVQRLFFKGTSKRSKADLESEVGKLGARLYSYTSRERTAVYGTCLNEDVPKLVEILSDVVQNSKFSDADLEKVKNEILRESGEVEANIKDVVFDYLHATAYQGTPLGQTVLGSQENIKSLTSKDLQYFVDSHFKASRTVLAAAGGVNQNELVQLAEQNLGKLNDTFDGEPATLSKCRYTGSEVRLRDDSLPYAYFALAVEGPGWNSPDRFPLLVATSVLGSYCRSLGKLEPYDLCHSYEAFNLPYSDTSLFGVYTTVEPMQCEDAASGILAAWRRLSVSITDTEINEAKNRLITNYMKQISGTKGNCEDIGSSILATGRRLSISEIESALSKLSPGTVRETVDKYTDNKCPVVAAVGPIENLTDYVNIRSKMYWVRL